MRCHEILTTWDGQREYVCTAERYTEHSHADGLALNTVRPLRPGERIIERDDCRYLDDGTRKEG